MKLPVLKAAAAGLAYMSSHALLLVRVLWLPALLLQAALVIVTPGLLDAQLALAHAQANDPAAAMSLVGPVFKGAAFTYLAMGLFQPMLITGPLRHLLRGEAPSLPFYLNFGGDEFRVLIALLLVGVMAGVAYAAGLLGVTAAGVVLAAVSKAAGAFAAGLLGIAFAVAFIWFLMRLSLVFPAAIDRRTLGVAETWRLTKGSARPLFLYWLIWFAIIVVVGLVYFAVALSGVFAEVYKLVSEAGVDPAAQEAIRLHVIEIERDLWTVSNPGFWPFAIATYLYTLVSSALVNVASGIAYRYIAQE